MDSNPSINLSSLNSLLARHLSFVIAVRKVTNMVPRVQMGASDPIGRTELLSFLEDGYREK